jgi:hypothetical protein
MTSNSHFRLLPSLLLVTCGVASVAVVVWLFVICRFIYTDYYHTQRQMYAPDDRPTWRDSIDYLLGLLLWSIPSLIVGLPGLILTILGFRRARKKDSSAGGHRRRGLGEPPREIV